MQGPRTSSAYLTLYGVVLSIATFGGFTQFVSAQGPASVQVTTVKSAPIESSMQFVGTLVPSRSVTIGSAVSGRVLTYSADAGIAVAAGSELATLRTATIEIELSAAKAELALRKAELLQLTNGSRPEEREQAEAGLALAANNLAFSERRMKRAESLEGVPGAISADELDNIQSNLLNAIQANREAEAAMKLVKDGPRAELIAQAQARVDVQQEAVNLLDDRIKKYTVRTPFAGFVVTEHTEAGAWLQQGDDVAEVIAIDPIEVEVFVPQDYIQFIQLGAKVNLVVGASGRKLTASVKRIIPQADRRTRTFPVILQMANRKDDRGEYRLRPGMTVQAELSSGTERQAVLVPKDAVVMNGTKATVYRVIDGKAFPVPVILASAVDGDYEIQASGGGDSKPLADGDVVVVKGNERLRPATPVMIVGGSALPSGKPARVSTVGAQ